MIPVWKYSERKGMRLAAGDQVYALTMREDPFGRPIASHTYSWWQGPSVVDQNGEILRYPSYWVTLGPVKMVGANWPGDTELLPRCWEFV